MILYEYECGECGARREVFRDMGDGNRPEQCKCGGRMGRRYSSMPAIFNCTGFYSTDYGKKKLTLADCDEPIVIDDSDPACDQIRHGKRFLKRIGNKQ